MKARWLILLLSVLLLLPHPAAGSAPGQAAPSSLPNGVAAGDVTQTSAVLWAHSTALGPLTFEVFDADGQSVAALSAEVTDPLVPVKAAVDTLEAGRAYTYRVTDAQGSSAEGTFRTPAALGTHAGLRFGVSGDVRGELAPFPAIRNAAALNLDFFVDMGDTIYADYPSPAVPKEQAATLEDYRAKHNEVYSEHAGLNSWADLRASTAFFVTIDDHEVANDFAGGAPPSSDPRFAGDPGAFINDTALYRSGLQAFQEYNPVRAEVYGDTGDPRTAGKPKLYRTQTFGSDAALFVLDARSFRDEEIPGIENYTNPVEVTRFLARVFDPTRTLLGQMQFADLLWDLDRAQQDGITWKLVIMPEPIQNLGVVAASDRYEGYAAERALLLRHIQDYGIQNVVFIAADLHGTLINNLAYQTGPLAAPVPVDSFEVVTGPVAYDRPFGPLVFELGQQVGLITPEQIAEYEAGDMAARDRLLETLLNTQVRLLRYSPLGLDDSGLAVTLEQGGYVAVHNFGWTEFEIDAATQQLRVTVYGIAPYSQADVQADPAGIAAREPTMITRFTVDPAASHP